jgi:hypothetical protein
MLHNYSGTGKIAKHPAMQFKLKAFFCIGYTNQK